MFTKALLVAAVPAVAAVSVAATASAGEKNGAIAAAQSAGPFSNAYGMGSRTLLVSTLNGAGMCNYFQALASLTISGLGTATVSSEAPEVICT